ncbi:STAG domain-containing protein [Neocallimastix lanati (nom. inval.)]|nr:STAG domain-containing protein [Neocallimastix sp. JGI-2020a]
MSKHSRQSRSSKANGRGSSKQLSKIKNSSKKRKMVDSVDENNQVNNFFEILQLSTANSVSIKLAIQEWKEAINEVDNTKPMAELINFILISSGCQGKISPDIFEEREDINKVLTELQNDSAAGLMDYPIISKQKQFTGNGNSRNTFIGKLRRFWRDWIKEMQYEIMNVDDNWIFDNLKVWIISISSSNFRPFCHTSTVIGLSLGIELCAVANSIQSELTIAERQINKEQAKKKIVQILEIEVKEKFNLKRR